MSRRFKKNEYQKMLTRRGFFARVGFLADKNIALCHPPRQQKAFGFFCGIMQSETGNKVLTFAPRCPVDAEHNTAKVGERQPNVE